MLELPRSQWQFGLLEIPDDVGTAAAGMLVVYELRSPEHLPEILVSFARGEWDRGLAIAIAVHFSESHFVPPLDDDLQVIENASGRICTARNRAVTQYILELLNRGVLRRSPLVFR